MRSSSFLLTALVLSGVACGNVQVPGARRTFVIVHGAWGGGWDWRTVADSLTARGHRVYRPTLTGLGERRHVASADIGLDVHVRDVVNLLEYEQLNAVTLVGHSYGGMVITGVAGRAPGRVRQVIFIDAFVPDSGESVFAILPPAQRSLLERLVRDGFIVPPWVPRDSPPPSDVPHPVRTFSDPVDISAAMLSKLRGRYILTLEPGRSQDDFSPFAVRAGARGWPVDTLASDHNPQRSAVGPLIALLTRD